MAAKGRPKGSTNVKVVIKVEPPRCPQCDSTRFKRLGPRNSIDSSGETDDGLPYNVIVSQRVQCVDCEQVRFNRSREYYPSDEIDSSDAESIATWGRASAH